MYLRGVEVPRLIPVFSLATDFPSIRVAHIDKQTRLPGWDSRHWQGRLYSNRDMYLLRMNLPGIRHPIIPDIPSNKSQGRYLGVHWTFRFLFAKTNMAHLRIAVSSHARTYLQQRCTVHAMTRSLSYCLECRSFELAEYDVVGIS